MTSPEAEYLEQRLNDQIDWYETKSAANQSAYKRLRLVEIVAAASIPLLAGYSDKHFLVGMAMGALGLVVAVLAGVIGLYRFQENWAEYRTSAEALKREKFLYIAKADPYDGDKPFELLAARVESLLQTETGGVEQFDAEAAEKNQKDRETPPKV